jgi:3'-5' exoribonuclease
MAIRDLVPGDRVEEFFALRKIERKEHQGGERLSLEFGDASGRIEGVIWDGYDGVLDQLSTGGIVKVRGQVGLYRERLQIKVERIRAATDEDAVDLSSFVPRAPVDPQTLASELDRFVESVTDEYLSLLLENLLAEGSARDAYLRAAGGKRWHHDSLGGLAEHSLNMARIVDLMCQVYPDLDRDLLISGALLHDIGKIEQYDIGAMIDYSDEGRLVGHINSGDFRVTTAIRAIEGFPPKTEQLLRHLIVSHQGQMETGSPVVPQTREAFILYYADEIDSKMGALRHVAEKTGDRPWSDYVNLIGRHIYFGGRANGSKAEEE